MTSHLLKESCWWAGEMTQWVRALAARPDDLSSFLGAHMVQEENPLPKLLSEFHVHARTHLQN